MKYWLLILLFFTCIIGVKGQEITSVATHVSTITSQFDPDKATAALINSIPRATRQKADSYSEGGYWLLLWNFLYAGFIAWLFLFGGLSAFINKLSGKSKKKGWANLFYIILYFALAFTLTLPLDCYQNFIREQQYGFSNQTFLQWLFNDGLTFFVEIIIGAPFFLLIYMLFKKVKDSWWLWGAGVTIVFIVAVLIIYPVFIAPIFNKYTPLKNGPLRERLLSMARANAPGIDQVYVFDESQQTKAFNANVSGFAGTGRIAINDNMVNGFTDNEIIATTGHEMGHYVLNHLYILVLEFGLLTLIGFCLVKWLFDRLLIKFSECWQIKSIWDITSLPLLVFLFTFYFFVLTPITNSITRVIENEADNYGLNVAKQPDAIASVFIKSADNHKVAPSYWEEIIFFDHPSRRHRIMAAMKWKAENLR